MTQALPVMLPISINTADAAVSLPSSPQNQRLGEQSAFTSLLIAQFKERGAGAADLLRTAVGEMVAPGQDVPEGGNRLPVSMAESGQILELLAGAGDSETAELIATLPRDGTDHSVLNNMLRALMDRSPGTGVSRAHTGDSAADESRRLAALGLRNFDDDAGLLNKAGLMNRADNAESVDIADEFLSRNHGRARANELPFAGYLPGDIQPKPAAMPAFLDQLPKLLTQKLTGNANGPATAASLPGVQQTGNVFSQLAGTGNQVPAPAVSVPMGHADWGHELGDRVRWLVNQNVQSAEIRLNPPELGPVRIHISVDQAQQVNVAFTSQHATVRDALETAMSHLRNALAENGLSLANGSVADQSAGEQQAENDDNDAFDNVAAGDEHAPTPDDVTAAGTGSRLAGLGLVDQFV